MPDACCTTSDCQEGVCLAVPLQTCLGPVMPHNVCAAGQCDENRPCTEPGAVCVPAGALGLKAASCLMGDCIFDSDCTERPGGSCQSIRDGCNCRSALYCVYPGDCLSSADCRPSGFCWLGADGPVCLDGITC
jgi:hypothetical protein